MVEVHYQSIIRQTSFKSVQYEHVWAIKSKFATPRPLSIFGLIHLPGYYVWIAFLMLFLTNMVFRIDYSAAYSTKFLRKK